MSNHGVFFACGGVAWYFFFVKKTLLIGNFGARNIGDELILASALDRYPDAVVATADAQWTQRFLEKKLETINPWPTGVRTWVIFLFKKKKAYRALRGDIEKIVLPGGGLLAIRDRAWWIWGSTVLGLRKFFPNVKIEMQAQGIDRPKNEYQKFWLRQVLKSVDSVTVRDDASAAVVQAAGGTAEVVGDAAEVWLRAKNLKNTGRLDRVVNTRTLWRGVWPDADGFVAMEPGDARWIPRTGMRVVCPETVDETLDLFCSVKSAVGQRLHFLILAHACGVEVQTLGDPYAEKVAAWCKKNDIKKMLP